jgi:hypothetical protein
LLYFVLGYVMISVLGLAFVPRLIRSDPSFSRDVAAARDARGPSRTAS